VHGTVRPTNLLINDAGRVKLSEFEQTASGGELRVPKGSKKYLAPELIKPEFGGFGPPLDLYCLGFTALEMLKGPQFDSLFPGTGKGAIDADIAWLRWHSSPEDLAPTKKLIKNIPDDLAHVLDHMLKKRVADRPQSAQAVLKELADRPLLAVPIEGIVDGAGAAEGNRNFGPAVVRELSQPVAKQQRMPAPPMTGPAASASAAAPSAKAKPAKASKSAKPVPPRFSKDWWNYQLGKPYILWPLCALILLAAGFYSFGNPFAGTGKAPTVVAKKEEPKEKAPDTTTMIPVTFNVQPDVKGLDVTTKDIHVPANPSSGNYLFTPGHYALAFKKEGFRPASLDVDISASSNKFDVKLEPEVKYVDVTLKVTPATAELKIGGEKKDLTDGSFTQKIEEGQPLVVEVSSDKFEPVSRTISADEIKASGNNLAFDLKAVPPPPPPKQPEPIKPEPPKVAKIALPSALIPKPGAPEDPDTDLPVRALSKRFKDAEPLEFALVKPGSYKFGAPIEKRRPGELTERAVKFDHPYYIAIHETTNAQYQKFSDAVGQDKAGTRWQNASRKWAAPQKLDPVNNQLPVTNVSAEQAQLFCKWVGGALPSEIEWECAVRGTDDAGFPYPWGKDEPTRDRCRIFNGEHLERGEGGPVPVDRMSDGANPLGMTHALGNVAEWCTDNDVRGGFILRGCSIATANINDVRVTWRAKGDLKGEESTGFRVFVQVNGAAPPEEPKSTAAAHASPPAHAPAPATASQSPAANVPDSFFTWDKMMEGVTSPSSDTAQPPATHASAK
jgi:formylglycine-generating enzyme required for sulfatase activity